MGLHRKICFKLFLCFWGKNNDVFVIWLHLISSCLKYSSGINYYLILVCFFPFVFIFMAHTSFGINLVSARFLLMLSCSWLLEYSLKII